MNTPVAFAVIGHDESEYLPGTISQVLEAAEDGDRVAFVDSASSDGSADVASALGVEVVPAPLGKGRAVQAALAWAGSGYLCLVDADIEESETNIPLTLRRAVERAGGTELLVGLLTEPARLRAVTPAVYVPFVGTFFPEVLALEWCSPMSGFRALRVDAVPSPLPPGYGVETYLNIELAMARGRLGSCPIGRYRGPLRGYANIPLMALEVGTTILDLAERHGRLSPRRRPSWERRLEEVVDVVSGQPPPGEDATVYLGELERLCLRPLPPAW